MIHTENTLTPEQLAGLVDVALQNRHTLSYLDTAMATFRMVGRNSDASAIALLGFLYAEGEIELLMRLRATWKLGRIRNAESILS
jgi:hypothetical protein